MKFKAKIIDLQYLMSGIESITNTDYNNALKLEFGDFLSIETWKERNVKLHRKYFALIKCTIYHLPECFDDEYRNINNLRRYLMIIIGEFDLIPSLKGDPIPNPRSINFKSIDDVKFGDIYQKTLSAIMKFFLKDMPLKDFEKNIIDFY